MRHRAWKVGGRTYLYRPDVQATATECWLDVDEDWRVDPGPGGIPRLVGPGATRGITLEEALERGVAWVVGES